MHIHTHYDNLQVPYTATDAEIRQAYRRLSRKYHPDLNPDPDAHRIMQLINRAYDVLSDPRKRAEHDFWIEAQRRRRMQEELGIPTTLPYGQRRTPAQTAYAYAMDTANNSQRLVLIGLIVISLILLGLVIWQGSNWFSEKPKQPTSPSITIISEKSTQAVENTPNNNPNNATNTNDNEAYARPTHAPNGTPFPNESGYIDNYVQVTSLDGGKINVENIRNSSDVFAQLYEQQSGRLVRTFFIEERSEFLLSDLATGEYFVRYNQLDTGEYLDSESVSVSAKSTATIYLQRSESPR